MFSAKINESFDFEEYKPSSLYESGEEEISKTSKETSSLSSIESLPAEIKPLILCHLDRQSDISALKTTSRTFRLLYLHNISAIQTAVILNSLHRYGTSIQIFGFWLKIAMSSSHCIPFLQGMKAAYKIFHRLSWTTPGFNFGSREETSFSQKQRMFLFDWDYVFDHAISTLMTKESNASALNSVTPDSIVHAVGYLLQDIETIERL